MADTILIPIVRMTGPDLVRLSNLPRFPDSDRQSQRDQKAACRLSQSAFLTLHHSDALQAGNHLGLLRASARPCRKALMRQSPAHSRCSKKEHSFPSLFLRWLKVRGALHTHFFRPLCSLGPSLGWSDHWVHPSQGTACHLPCFLQPVGATPPARPHQGQPPSL